MTPHKHAELIKAWADDCSSVVEFRVFAPGPWTVVHSPSWEPTLEYRIKPAKKSPGQLLAEAQDYCWTTCNLSSRLRFEAIAKEFLSSMKEQE